MVPSPKVHRNIFRIGIHLHDLNQVTIAQHVRGGVFVNQQRVAHLDGQIRIPPAALADIAVVLQRSGIGMYDRHIRILAL
ncbi:hypothetical protein D9M68_403690 [compost metagenome]